MTNIIIPYVPSERERLKEHLILVTNKQVLLINSDNGKTVGLSHIYGRKKEEPISIVSGFLDVEGRLYYLTSKKTKDKLEFKIHNTFKRDDGKMWSTNCGEYPFNSNEPFPRIKLGHSKLPGIKGEDLGFWITPKHREFGYIESESEFYRIAPPQRVKGEIERIDYEGKLISKIENGVVNIRGNPIGYSPITADNEYIIYDVPIDERVLRTLSGKKGFNFDEYFFHDDKKFREKMGEIVS